MSFDKPTRNLLAGMVANCRKLLIDDFSEQLSREFGMHPDGLMLDVKSLQHLDPAGVVTAGQLREEISHLEAVSTAKVADRRKDAYGRLVRELGFTAMNRLAALRMCEERGLIAESIRKGSTSEGASLFARIMNSAGGDTYATYRLYLELLFDELAVDLGVLFDRSHPTSLLFPSDQCLTKLLNELNAPALSHLWSEDETIGWIYQYWNPKEERDAMRDLKRGGSAVPRNSRELAVRNQFFTPRYVVQFLTDNTLGRQWLEMHKETALADKCEYLVRSDETPQVRPKKDPRDLRILDPACGSGHFLLYAFDLLETMYEEAWKDAGSPRSEETGKALREDYPEEDVFRRAVPGLIMRHNLWGIDIDSRACQIAALALWLRAQRWYQRLGLRGSERQAITKSNVVCAEPMPGERELLEDFLETIEQRLRPLVRTIWEKMLLAGDAGSLLKVDEDIKQALAEAREERFIEAPPIKVGLFGPAEHQEVLALLASPEEQAFWLTAEGSLLSALESFAKQVAGLNLTQRRLFADDAEMGFAFIDLVRNRFDVVLMNPPFGAGSSIAKAWFEKIYPRTKNDVFAAFVERGIELLNPGGLLGAITSRTGFFLSSFQKWREEILLKTAPPVVFADLGFGVMDAAMVEAAAYCLEKPREVPA